MKGATESGVFEREAGVTTISVLVVDDCPEALDLVAAELEEEGLVVVRARDGAEAWSLFRDVRPDAIVTDVRMPESDGFELLRRVREVSQIPFVLMTAHAEVSSAVSAVREGADDYLCFPEDLSRLEPLVRELVGRQGVAPGDVADRSLVGCSEAIEGIRQALRRQAPLDHTVLIRGESGTGRATAARVLHELGNPDEPFHEVDSSHADRSGLRGVVLLKDFHCFDARSQRRWVTELHRSHAASSPIRRLLLTSCMAHPREPHVEALHPRVWRHVSAHQIEMPSLAERPEDIPFLARSIAHRAAQEFGGGPVRLAPDAIEELMDHRWPGNLHELVAVLEKAVTYAASGYVSAIAIREGLRLVITQRQDGLARRRAARHAAEREELVALLDDCGGNVAEMGRRLGLTRGAVVYRLKKHGLAI